jgi:hypothetical protein
MKKLWHQVFGHPWDTFREIGYKDGKVTYFCSCKKMFHLHSIIGRIADVLQQKLDEVQQ